MNKYTAKVIIMAIVAVTITTNHIIDVLNKRDTESEVDMPKIGIKAKHISKIHKKEE